jgi:hypothetical protein
MMEGYSRANRSMPAGILYLSKAMTSWAEKDYSLAASYFDESMGQFKGGINGPLFQAIVQTLRGSRHAALGQVKEADAHLTEALRLYMALNNQVQIKRMNMLLASIRQ